MVKTVIESKKKRLALADKARISFSQNVAIKLEVARTLDKQPKSSFPTEKLPDLKLNVLTQAICNQWECNNLIVSPIATALRIDQIRLNLAKCERNVPFQTLITASERGKKNLS